MIPVTPPKKRQQYASSELYERIFSEFINGTHDCVEIRVDVPWRTLNIAMLRQAKKRNSNVMVSASKGKVYLEKVKLP